MNELWTQQNEKNFENEDRRKQNELKYHFKWCSVVGKKWNMKVEEHMRNYGVYGEGREARGSFKAFAVTFKKGRKLWKFQQSLTSFIPKFLLQERTKLFKEH